MDSEIVPPLRILLLGPPQIEYGGRPLRIQRRLLRTLLFYLAAQSEPVGRQTLIDLFWPDEDEEDARRHLRETLSKLRLALPLPTLIHAAQDLVSLDQTQVYVDVREFQTLLHQVRIYLKLPLTAPLPEAVYQKLCKAVGLWRGQRFLAGVDLPSTEGFDDWLTYMSATLESALLTGLEVLAEHAALSGDLDEAIHWARRALQMDESHWRLRARLIGWLCDLGQYQAAQEECERVQRDLAAEGITEVPEEYRALCQRLHQALLQPRPPDPVPWFSLRTLHVPFVGRDDALETLRTMALQGGIAMLWGEAGSGKSRLMFELYQSLQPAPRLVLANALAHERDTPYHPLAQALREAVLTEEWQTLPPHWLQILLPLLPELAVYLPPTTPALAENRETHLPAAIAYILRHLTQHGRLLLFLDDAQWCDTATLHALAHLVDQRFFSRGNLLVIAARPEEPNPALQTFLTTSPVSWLVKVIHLGPLATPAVAQMVHYALGQTVSSTWVESLARATGGNPLFILETLRALLEAHPDLSPENLPTTFPVAQSVRALANERLHLLRPQTRQILLAAAVLGETFRLDVLQAMLQEPAELVVEAVEEMEQAYLVHPCDQMRGGYTFQHPLIREVLLLESSEARLQFLHLRAARALEVCGEAQAAAASVAEHFEAGGEGTLAAHYWVEAAYQAALNGQPQAAEQAFQRAEELLLRLERPLSAELIHRLYAGWAEVAFNRYDLETSERCYTALLRHGEQRYDALMIGSGLSGLGRVATVRMQARQAMNYLDQALPYLEKSGHVEEQMEALNRKAAALLLLQRFYDAVSLYQRVLEMGRAVETLSGQRALGNARYQLAKTYYILGWPERARLFAEQALAQSRALYTLGYRGRALLALALAQQEMGDFTTALETCHQGLQEAERWGNAALAARLWLCRAQVCLKLGLIQSAWEALEHARAQVATLNKRNPVLSEVYVTQGDLWLALGDYAAALTDYRAGLEVAQDLHSSTEALYRLGWALVLSGQSQSGLNFLHRAIELTRTTEVTHVALAAEMALAEALYTLGNLEDAQRTAHRAADEAAQRKMQYLLLRYHALQAYIAQRKHAHDLVFRHARLLIEQAQALQSPLFETIGLGLALQTVDGDEIKGAFQQRLEALRQQLLHGFTTDHLRQRFEQRLHQWLNHAA
jgi:predicted ATPase/DNA-binding SARP family transcriptional activator